MVTLKGTSSFVCIGTKNELPEKSFTFVLIRKDKGMDWHSKGATQNDVHPNINRRNGFFMSRRWVPLIHTLKAKRQQAFSNGFIDLTSNGFIDLT
jgi:hypothetical protein